MLIEDISTNLQKGKAKDVRALVEQALNEGFSPAAILNEGLIAGMSIIGGKFKRNEVYVPEVLIAARAMNAGLDILKPVLASTGIKPIGKALICTVKGDLHDIGKNLVKMMLEGQGILCIDLGVDADEEKVISGINEHQPDIVCLSALLSTTMMSQKEIIVALEQTNLRHQVWIMVGGAPVTMEFAKEIRADSYAPDAASAAIYAKNYLLKKYHLGDNNETY
jgi:5-methyltetrahydrofolate--homocysteine methyltransferase